MEENIRIAYYTFLIVVTTFIQWQYLYQSNQFPEAGIEAPNDNTGLS